MEPIVGNLEELKPFEAGREGKKWVAANKSVEINALGAKIAQTLSGSKCFFMSSLKGNTSSNRDMSTVVGDRSFSRL